MSFGFEVKDMESSGTHDVGSMLSGDSEGFRSAQATPTANTTNRRIGEAIQSRVVFII